MQSTGAQEPVHTSGAKLASLQTQVGLSDSFLQGLGCLGLPADDLGECLDAYRLLFGVDDGSLQQVAQSVGKSMEEFRAAMKSQDLLTLCREDWRLSFMTCVVMKAVLSHLTYIHPSLGGPCHPLLQTDEA